MLLNAVARCGLHAGLDCFDAMSFAQQPAFAIAPGLAVVVPSFKKVCFALSVSAPRIQTSFHSRMWTMSQVICKKVFPIKYLPPVSTATLLLPTIRLSLLNKPNTQYSGELENPFRIKFKDFNGFHPPL